MGKQPRTILGLMNTLQDVIEKDNFSLEAHIWIEWDGKYFRLVDDPIIPIRYAPNGDFGITIPIERIHDD